MRNIDFSEAGEICCAPPPSQGARLRKLLGWTIKFGTPVALVGYIVYGATHFGPFNMESWKEFKYELRGTSPPIAHSVAGSYMGERIPEETKTVQNNPSSPEKNAKANAVNKAIEDALKKVEKRVAAKNTTAPPTKTGAGQPVHTATVKTKEGKDKTIKYAFDAKPHKPALKPGFTTLKGRGYANN